MSKSAWKVFPYSDASYAYAGAALKKNWARLHRGDAEPWPQATAAQEAWRAYHAGDFAKAVELGLKAGDASGINAANKAAMIYANSVETDEAHKLALLQEVARRCEKMQVSDPGNANAWYYHAYALGRYSQGISVAKALADGLGGKVRASLEKAIELEPKHADAHIALGTWHAEIINKIGAMVGGLTYGAKKDAGETHFKTALKLNPDSPIAMTEYAAGMVMLFGRSRMKEAEKLYAQAAQCTPADAMERLDIEAAKAELEG
jgi:tetratricopeptide (TPR) repeat protein